MAAAVKAIMDKKRKRQAAGLGKRGPGAAEEEVTPPAWARACTCWTRFWSQTTIDEKFWSLQPKAREYYNHKRSQQFVALLIFGNFICSIVELTIDPVRSQCSPSDNRTQ